MILASTLHPTSITGEGFRMHEGVPTSHSPQATMRAGGVQWLPLANQRFDDDSYCQKCSLELQFHLIYCQGPEGPGPHASSPGAISPCPSIAALQLPTAHSPQPCLAMGPTKLGPLVGPQPIPALVHPQGSAWCLGLGLPPSPLVPMGIPPASTPPRSSPPCSALTCISLIVYLIACNHSWDSPLLLLKKLLVF